LKIIPKKEFEDIEFEEGISSGLSVEEAKERARGLRGTYTRSTGEIVIKKGASSRTKLHELGHKAYGTFQTIPTDRTGWPETTWGDTAYDEILANRYAWKHQGRELTPRVAVPAIFALKHNEGATPQEAVDTAVAVLRDYVGIPVSRKEKKDLLRIARAKYEREEGPTSDS